MVIMFTETAAMAEIQYRQERFLKEAEAHRLARSVAPARKSRRAQLAALATRRTQERHEVAADHAA